MKSPTSENAKALANQLGVDAVVVVAIAQNKFATATFANSQSSQQASRIQQLLNKAIRDSKQQPAAKQGSVSKRLQRANDHVEAAIEQTDRILEMIDELPEAGWDFGDSVSEKVRDIAENISRHERVTEAQQDALDNMESGVSRWLHD